MTSMPDAERQACVRECRSLGWALLGVATALEEQSPFRTAPAEILQRVRRVVARIEERESNYAGCNLETV